MIIHCTHCTKKYRIKLDRLPARGIKATCAACGERFTVRPGEDAAPTLKVAQPVERKQAWVLTGDPGVDEMVSRKGLDGLREQMDVTVIAADARESVSKSFSSGDIDAPDVLLFGDLHVILEDDLVLLMARRTTCRRVLVSTHLNQELLAQATQFAGVDAHLTAPFARNTVIDALGILAL